MALARGMLLTRSFPDLNRCLLITTRVNPGARLTCSPVARYSKANVSRLGGGKGGKGLGPSLEKKVLPVVTDPEKLTTYVCGTNIYKTGEDVKLKEDSEYPDWLWTLRTGKPKTIDELDPNTIEYWKLARKMYRKSKNALKKGKKF